MRKYLSDGCFTELPSITPPATPPFPSRQHSAVRSPPSSSCAPASGFCHADCWAVATALTTRNRNPGLQVAQTTVMYSQRHKTVKIVVLRTSTSLFRSDRALIVLQLLHKRNREKSGTIQHMGTMLCFSGAGEWLWELPSLSCCTHLLGCVSGTVHGSG